MSCALRVVVSMPRLCITSVSSDDVIIPSPFASNIANATRSSARKHETWREELQCEKSRDLA